MQPGNYAKKEHWLQAILDQSLMGVLILKSVCNRERQITDFEYIFVNDKAKEILKYQNLKGKYLTKEFTGSNESGILSNCIRTLSTGESWEGKISHRYKGGERWYWVKVLRLDKESLALFYSGSLPEMTGDSLAYNKQLLQATFDSSPNYIQVFEAVRDHQGHIVDFTWILQNRISIKTYGNLVGKRLLKVNPGVVDSGTFDRLVRVTETGAQEQAELIYNYENYNNWFFQSVVKLDDGVALTATDITAQKIKEQEILQLKEDLRKKATNRYKALFNSIDQGYCTIEMKFDEKGKPVDYLFLEVSPSFEHQTGIKNGLGKWMRDIAPSHEDFWFDKYGAVAISRKADRFEYFSTPLNRWWSVYAFPIDAPELRHVGVLFNDITASKKAEEEKELLFDKVAREKAVLKATIDSLPLPVWITDKKGRFIMSNKQTERIWGKKAQTASDISDYKMFRGWQPGSKTPLKPEEWPLSKALLEGKPTIEEELEVERFDGNKAIILINAAPVRDEKGDTIGGIVVEQDITERKKIEKSLQMAEAQKAYLLKLSDALQFREDPFQIQYEAVRILGEHLKADRAGYAEDTGDAQTVSISRNYTKDVPGIEGTYRYDTFGSELLKQLRKGQTVIVKDIAKSPLLLEEAKGEISLLQKGTVANKPLIKNGQLTAILFVQFKEKHEWTSVELALLDATAERIWTAVEWVRAEKALRESNMNYLNRLQQEVKERTSELQENKHFIQLITDSTPDILFVYDIKKWKIIYVNKGVTTTLGYTPDEVYASDRKGFELMLHPDDLRKRISEMASMEHLKQGEVRESEFRIKDREGKTHWFHVRDLFFKAGKKGKTEQVLSICQDVTARMKALDAYREEKNRSEELKRMNELMDTFVFAAAHDLKAPVSNLKMLTQIIAGTADRERKLILQQRYAEIAETLDKTISGLVKVLTVEKDVEAGTKRLHFQKMFNKVVNEMKDEIAAVNPQFQLDFSECKSIVFIESYLSSIFRNMLSNSLRFKAAGRPLQITIRSGCEKKYVWLSFTDNGTGIDLEKYGKDLFKPFKRFSSNLKGVGLGLNLIRNIVTKNGGNIEVESKKSQGTTFRIYLVPYKDRKQ